MNMDQLAFENLIMDLQLIRWGNLTNEELDRIMDAITQAKNNAKAEQDKRGGQRMTFEELAYKVEDWAREKGIDKTNKDFPFAQIEKVQEEVQEAFQEFTELTRLHDVWKSSQKKTEQLFKEYCDTEEKFVMEIGDIFVTLIILCQQEGINFTEALERAYDKISKRKGKTIDGQFVKEEE